MRSCAPFSDHCRLAPLAFALSLAFTLFQQVTMLQLFSRCLSAQAYNSCELPRAATLFLRPSGAMKRVFLANFLVD